MPSSSADTLRTRVLEKSVNQNNFDKAREEWNLASIYYAEDEDGRGCEQCLCGHRPIKEVCELQHWTNDECILVGNCCVKKFFKSDMADETSKIFDAVKKVKKEIQSTENKNVSGSQNSQVNLSSRLAARDSAGSSSSSDSSIILNSKYNNMTFLYLQSNS